MFQSIATRMLIFYFVMQGLNYFKAKPPQSTNPSAPGSDVPGGAATSLTPGNMFPKGTRFDIYVYISESMNFDEFENEKLLYWVLPDVEYGNWNIGKDGDGNIHFDNQIELTPVRFFLNILLNCCNK